MSLHTLPKPQSPKPLMPPLAEAIYDCIFRAVLQELPDHPKPDAFAKELIEIADSDGLPIETLEFWLHDKPAWKEFTIPSFKRWIRAYQDTQRQVLKTQTMQLCECGHPLELVGENLFCAECGE